MGASVKHLAKLLLLFLLPISAIAKQRVVNVYVWTEEIPAQLVHQFEKETGIKVNLSLYQSNEVMLAKLRTAQTAGYDVVMPSSYFIQRMHKLGLLEKLDKSKLPNLKNLDPEFLHPAFDKDLSYSIPFLWGVTGINVNKKYYDPKTITQWSDFWEKRFKNQLILLDDPREVFSMALLKLGYSPNDNNPAHIKQAYEQLKALMPNIKVFSSDTVMSIMIDEDARIGMMWNGDAYKTSLENEDLAFIFPKDGFVIWVDTFSIPSNAPHKKEAYEFINFMLRAESAKQTALIMKYPVTNKAGKQLLPAKIRNNKIIYPSEQTLKRGQFQTDPGEAALELYENYWEMLKMGA